MNTYTYTWHSAPESLIVQTKTATEAYTKVAQYILKKYKHEMSLKEMVEDIQEEGVLAEVMATL